MSKIILNVQVDTVIGMIGHLRRRAGIIKLFVKCVVDMPSGFAATKKNWIGVEKNIFIRGQSCAHLTEYAFPVHG